MREAFHGYLAHLPIQRYPKITSALQNRLTQRFDGSGCYGLTAVIRSAWGKKPRLGLDCCYDHHWCRTLNFLAEHGNKKEALVDVSKG